MPIAPWQPEDADQKNSRVPFLLIALLALVAAVLSVAAFRQASDAGRKVAPASASPTLPLAANAPSSTPRRLEGLSGPAPATAPATLMPTFTPALPIQAGQPATHTPIFSTATATPLSAAEQSLLALEESRVPVRDLYSITARLRLKNGEAIPQTTGEAPGNYSVGHSETFYMSDILARRYYTITATIRQVTDHAYWYVQNGRSADKAALKEVAQTFESKIYPTDHKLFGSEWTPGVDNDPRIVVLFASIAGAGGYYASADEYTRLINPFSNQREIIYINTGSSWDPATGDLESIEGTLAHEFQHMIHWHENAGHDVWLNEGASVLATTLNGYDTVGVDNDFMAAPDVQLNAWQSNPDAARANYGAAFLFLDYLRTHYGGDKALRSLVAAKGQGTDAVDNALASLGSNDRFLDLFKRWTLANLLDGQPGAEQKGLDYPDREVRVSPQIVEKYPKSLAADVSQFGADYVQLQPPEAGSTLLVSFSGQPETHVVAAPAHSEQALWWSNRGDLADTTMTRSFDLRSLKTATLDFYTWFDTEEDLDYAYVEASTDGGATWTTLKAGNTTTTNPNGSNLGSAYTGKSVDRLGAEAGGWLHEQIDITPYAGKEVMLRFEYITDDGYNAGGFAVDDISIPELGYRDDAEGRDDWQKAGFVRLANKLPQTYYLAVVKYRKDGFDVQPVEVAPSGEARFTVDGLGKAGPYEKAVLVIAATANHTLSKADYELNIREK